MHQRFICSVLNLAQSSGSKIAKATAVTLLALWLAMPAAAESRDAMIESTLQAVVGLRTLVPDTARTAFSLGTEREGNGIVISDDGLVLTIGYLIMESSSIEVTNAAGEYVGARMIAYDYDSGFGLVQAMQPLGLKGIQLGESADLLPGDAALIVAHIGPHYMRPAEIVDIREFPGYWEYLLDQAIFTSPPFHGFGGAALINTEGKLVGVGSLIVHDAKLGPQPTPGNMFVPIDLLKPIMSDLLQHGRDLRQKRPWLGIYTSMSRGHLFVTRVALDSPAQAGGVRRNDIIIAVNGEPVSGMADFLRKVWATGPAGIEIHLSVLQQGQVKELKLDSGDRYDWLQLNPDTPAQHTAMLGWRSQLDAMN